MIRILLFALVPVGALMAGEVAPVMTLDTPSSFTMAVTRLDGSVVEAKAYLDVGRRRAEFTAGGLDLTVIARDDENEMYGIFPQQGLMMHSRIDAPLLERYRTFVSAFGPQGKFDRVGHEMCEGYACDKYNVTSATGQIYYFWYDPVRQAPVKIVAATHRFSLTVTDFKRGPQPAVLFLVPNGDRRGRYYSIPPFIPQPKTVAPASPAPAAAAPAATDGTGN